MVKYLKFNLHSLFIDIAPVSCVSKTKQNVIATILSNTITLPSLQKFVTHFLLGTFYSYRTARICSEPRSVQRRLSFAVEVTTTSGNWKHPLPLKIIFNALFQWLLCFKNGCHVTPPTLRHLRTAPQKCVSRTYIYIYIYIYMYIRIAFSIELRLRVSRSLRSLANNPPLRSDLIGPFYAPM